MDTEEFPSPEILSLLPSNDLTTPPWSVIKCICFKYHLTCLRRQRSSCLEADYSHFFLRAKVVQLSLSYERSIKNLDKADISCNTETQFIVFYVFLHFFLVFRNSQYRHLVKINFLRFIYLSQSSSNSNFLFNTLQLCRLFLNDNHTSRFFLSFFLFDLSRLIFFFLIWSRQAFLCFLFINFHLVQMHCWAESTKLNKRQISISKKSYSSQISYIHYS